MGTQPPGLLSFSVERILSKEIGPRKTSSYEEDGERWRGDWTLDGCDPTVGLRCCYLSGDRAYYPPHHFLHQAALLHAPKPIRPFPAKFQVKVSYERLGRGDCENGLSSGGKRKRSWSRAVFSSLQRKGLEKRFQLQQYITKPDRRQLAATLGLTDAQVKVWFQNRRMKWRHTKEMKGNVQQPLSATSARPQEQTG